MSYFLQSDPRQEIRHGKRVLYSIPVEALKLATINDMGALISFDLLHALLGALQRIFSWVREIGGKVCE
jgi:hypothetical protein